MRCRILLAALSAAVVRAAGAVELAGVLEVPFLEANSPNGGHLAATDDLLVVASNGGASGMAIFIRDPQTSTGWRLEQVLPVEGRSAIALAGSTVVRAEVGPVLSLYERELGSWERVGAIPVKLPAQYLGSLLAADEGRIVALAGQFPNGVELLTFERDPTTTAGWSVVGRQLLAGYHSPRVLTLVGDRLGLVARVLGATGRAEVFEWSGGQWLSSLVVEDSTPGSIHFGEDLVGIGLPYESTPPASGSIQVFRRDAAGVWSADAVATAPIEADGFTPGIGHHFVFVGTGDLVVASNLPPGCPSGDPTCIPPARDVRLVQLSRPHWSLRARWQGEADDAPTQPGPDGWVGRTLAVSRDQVIATTTHADRPGLRVFRIGQPSPLEVPTLGRPALVGMVLMVLAAGLVQLAARRRPSRAPPVGGSPDRSGSSTTADLADCAVPIPARRRGCG